MRHLLRNSLAAGICIGLTSTAAFAQAQLSSAFDGNWWDPSRAGNGVLFDYIESGSNPAAGSVFAALYTYDADGEPAWLTIQSNGEVGNTTGEIAATIYRSSGGAFDDSHTPGSVDTAPIGEATIVVNDCSSITLELAPNAASGLDATSYDLEPFSGPVACAPVATQCPATTSDLGNGQCGLPNEIAGSLRLPKGKTYVVQGQVTVVAGGVLTVDPGVTVMGSTNQDQPNFIAVLADGQIIADGTRDEPITFTGPVAEPGSWAGLVLAGRSLCNDAPDTELGCNFEAIPDVVFGGQKFDDNSGILRYVRILWAGQVINEDEELNSLTLCGVGSGTTLEYVQVHGGLDDGFEMFGGSVNGRYLVASQVGDDMFDFDDGYFGRLQFLLGWQGSQNHDQTPDSNGVESDNSNDNNDIQPRTKPVISNLTLVGSVNGNEGARIRRGSAGLYHNTLITGFKDRCLNVDGTSSQGLPNSDLAFHYSFVGECGGGAFEGGGQALWNAGTGNRTGNPQLNGWIPAAGSPLRTGGQAPDDGFFINANYVGAFDGVYDWTAGWIYGPGAR